MRGYKNFEGTPHPGDLCHLVEIGYTENAINVNGYPEPKDVVVCRVWASAVDAGNQHYRAADVMNTEQVINFTIASVRPCTTRISGCWRKVTRDIISPPTTRPPAPTPCSGRGSTGRTPWADRERFTLAALTDCPLK